MLVGAMTASWAVAQADQREGVVVAAADLPAGHTLGSQDVRVAEIAGAEELAAIPSAQMQQVVGQTLTVPLGEGTLVAEAALAGPEDYPEAGQAVVGAAVQPNQYPASLREGAHVSVITAESSDPTEEGATERAASPEAISAQVQSLAPGDGEAATLVELVVDEADAQTVAQAASADQIVLAHTRHRGS